MGIVAGSTNWNGQDNFQDFIQFHADKLCMTREEYMAHYGSANAGINEAKNKYIKGLDTFNEAARVNAFLTKKN